MASGETFTSALADSLNTMVAEARQVREFQGGATQLVERHTLSEGTGLSWREISMAKLTAQKVPETSRLNNPQQLSDSVLSITPQVVGIQTTISDRVVSRVSKVTWAQVGSLRQNALNRLADQDTLAVFDGATTSIPGAGSTLVSGNIQAMAIRISGNTTEPGPDPIRAVLHSFQTHDLTTELTAGVGTYPTPDGISADVFKNRFRGKIGGAEVFQDDNITIDSNNDAHGGVFSQAAILCIFGRSPYTKTKDEPDLGGGATSIYLYNEYAHGERSAGNWLFRCLSDATVPTG